MRRRWWGSRLDAAIMPAVQARLAWGGASVGAAHLTGVVGLVAAVGLARCHRLGGVVGLARFPRLAWWLGVIGLGGAGWEDTMPSTGIRSAQAH